MLLTSVGASIKGSRRLERIKSCVFVRQNGGPDPVYRKTPPKYKSPSTPGGRPLAISPMTRIKDFPTRFYESQQPMRNQRPVKSSTIQYRSFFDSVSSTIVSCPYIPRNHFLRRSLCAGAGAGDSAWARSPNRAKVGACRRSSPVSLISFAPNETNIVHPVHPLRSPLKPPRKQVLPRPCK